MTGVSGDSHVAFVSVSSPESPGMLRSSSTASGSISSQSASASSPSVHACTSMFADVRRSTTAERISSSSSA
jgi:hypothetical protein